MRPDIAILDIGLPVMDGYDLATALRGLPGLADLQLIAVTNGTARRSIGTVLRVRAFDII